MFSKPTYKDHIIFNKDLIAVVNNVSSVKFDKPIYLGMCVSSIYTNQNPARKIAFFFFLFFSFFSFKNSKKEKKRKKKNAIFLAGFWLVFFNFNSPKI